MIKKVNAGSYVVDYHGFWTGLKVHDLEGKVQGFEYKFKLKFETNE